MPPSLLAFGLPGFYPRRMRVRTPWAFKRRHGRYRRPGLCG
ncbi:hypothetical protein TCCBUS3UF1_15920 [Thermus sp. CCB_US3_UF1]|nr:hypothetical protein TCCBUS3UF1_15920 [Thermus sp. CCB_US3_UF1]